MGEVLSCVEFVQRLRDAIPPHGLFVSSIHAGRTRDGAGKSSASVVDGVFYAPVDYVFAVRRVLRTLQPGVVVVAETEIWPNLFREVKRTEAGLAIVNGRISDRAFPRYLRGRWVFRAVLPQADSILAQTRRDRGAVPGAGRAARNVSMSAGNFKYDFEARRGGARVAGPAWIGWPAAAGEGVDRRQHHASGGGGGCR